MGRNGVARSLALLTLLLVGLGVVMAVWVSLDRRPAEWDHANHLERALDCHRILADPARDRYAEIVAMSSFYPPLVLCATGLAYFVGPVTPLTAQAVIWGFLVIGTFAVWEAGRRLLADEAAARLGAVLFATAPFVVFSLLRFQLDLPLAAMVALALALVVRVEAAPTTARAVALGLALGLGMLVKPPFAVYLLPPILWLAWRGWRAPDRRARLRGLALALGVGALLALPWYGPRLAGLPMQIMNRSFKQAVESPPALTMPAILFYPRVYVPLFGVISGLLALWGVWAVRRRPGSRGLVWAALLPWVIFILIQNKNFRYALPLVPALALAAAAGIAGLGPRARRPVMAAAVLLGLIQVSATAFAVPPAPHLRAFLVPLVMADPPVGADWKHAEVLAALIREFPGGVPRVSVVPNDNYFSVSNFRYEALRDRLPITFMRAWDASPFGVDAAIVKTGDQGPDAASDKAERIMRAFEGGDPWLAAAYPVVARFPLPDRSEGMVRVRRPPPVEHLSAEELAARLSAAATEYLTDFAREPLGLAVKAQHQPDALRRGEVDRVVLEADSALVGEHARGRPALRVRDLRVVAHRLRFNPGRLAATGRLEILDLEGLTVERLRVDEADLLAFLRAQRGMSRAGLALGAGEARMSVGLGRGPTLAARVRFVPGVRGAPFALDISQVRLGGVALPELLVGWIVRHLDPTPRLRRLPVPVTIPSLRIAPGRVEIAAAPPPRR
ncbi:MAG TPA: LmeA family phospholipid-binding protein [Methylomirabilota bacterium]|nr:LmeA family phospholipid-binding protein [Methylomirabilota bacterium]